MRASGVMGYDRRTSELSNALLHMKQDTLHQNRVSSKRQTDPKINIQNLRLILDYSRLF